MKNVPTLTLDTDIVLDEDFITPTEQITLTVESDSKALAKEAQKDFYGRKDGLSEEEVRLIDDFSQKIDIRNNAQMLQYGNGAQKKIAAFSESALRNVRTKDMDGVGKMLSGLVLQLRGFSEEESKGFRGFFKRTSNQITQFQAKYDSAEKNVDRIVDALESHKIVLLKDVAMLDQMYSVNLSYFKELTLYIIAGREKLERLMATELVELRKKADLSKSAEDAQIAKDFAEQCNRFDKKLHDLELTRLICIQMGPQIRLVQTNDSMMIEKIQTSIVNTIPLWKNQMVLSLGLTHSQQAIAAQREVTNLTNELLRKNADTLKINTIEAAKEAERAIVDIETLRHTNESLISTLDEITRIQQEGREKRLCAETELRKLESDLKDKLLELNSK